MKIDLSHRHALVTGASKGIGYAIADNFAEAGAQVTVVARSKPQFSNKFNFIEADFSSPERAIATLSEYLLDTNVDILVNNTGGPNPGSLTDATWDNFTHGLDMHLRMSQELTKLVVPNMQGQHFGRIINVISTSVKSPIPGLGVSNTIRGAMANWSKTLSFELGAFGITVNNLLPGFIETDRLKSIIFSKAEASGESVESVSDKMRATIPAGHFGRPEDLANLAVFLASDKAAYINGANIPVDGGKTPVL